MPPLNDELQSKIQELLQNENLRDDVKQQYMNVMIQKEFDMSQFQTAQTALQDNIKELPAEMRGDMTSDLKALDQLGMGQQQRQAQILGDIENQQGSPDDTLSETSNLGPIDTPEEVKREDEKEARELADDSRSPFAIPDPYRTPTLRRDE